MKRWRQWLVVGIAALVSLPGAARAESEVDILLNKLVEKGTLTGVEAGQIRREISETKETRNKQLAKEIVPESARNWSWKGDIRLRNEYRNRTGSGQDINRQRIRFRYGFEGKINDQLKVGARLATGSASDPVSTNQTFNTAFNHVNILLDRAFVTYSPEIPGVTKVSLSGGIIENPFLWVGPLVWDEDLNFQGLAAHVDQQIGPVNLFANNGLFSLESDISEAATLWSTQEGVIVQPYKDADPETPELLKNFKVTGAIAYHDYKNVTNPVSEQINSSVPTSIISTAGGTKGNSANLQDINLVNPTFEIASQYADVPFSFFSDWVRNTAATPGMKNGYIFGFKFGKARIPFDLMKGWEAGYYFERLDPDATFGAFSDSDFGNGGGTNHRGSVYWLKLAVLKNSTFGFKYFNTRQVKGAKNNADIAMMDWVTTF